MYLLDTQMAGNGDKSRNCPPLDEGYKMKSTTEDFGWCTLGGRMNEVVPTSEAYEIFQLPLCPRFPTQVEF